MREATLMANARSKIVKIRPAEAARHGRRAGRLGLRFRWRFYCLRQPGKTLLLRTRDGPGFLGLNQQKWSGPDGTSFLISLNNASFSRSEPLYPDHKRVVWAGNFWSEPLLSGSNHWRGTYQKKVV